MNKSGARDVRILRNRRREQMIDDGASCLFYVHAVARRPSIKRHEILIF